MSKIKIIILTIITILVASTAVYAGWYSYERQVKITEAEKCRYDMENPGEILRLCSALVPPPIWDLARGNIVVQGIPNLMKLNPYSLKDVLLGNYTVTIDLGSKMTAGSLVYCNQSATTTDCSKLPNNISHYENQYIGISLDYPSDLYADGQNNSFQVTFMAPDDIKRASSASMGALAFYLKENQTIAEYIEKLKPQTLSIKDSTIAGRKAKEITSTPDGYSGSTWIHILVETKKGMLQISFLKDTNRAQIYRSVIDSIRFND